MAASEIGAGDEGEDATWYGKLIAQPITLYYANLFADHTDIYTVSQFELMKSPRMADMFSELNNRTSYWKLPVFVVVLSVLLVNNAVAPTLNTSPTNDEIGAQAPSSTSSSTSRNRNNNINRRFFSLEEHLKFARDGYLVIPASDARELLSTQHVQNLVRAGEAKVAKPPPFPFYFTVSAMGAMFEEEEENVSAGESHDGQAEVHEQKEEETPTAAAFSPAQAFRQAALFSNLPSAVAELMQLDPRKQTLRVLRDIFFAKSITDNGAQSIPKDSAQTANAATPNLATTPSSRSMTMTNSKLWIDIK